MQQIVLGVHLVPGALDPPQDQAIDASCDIDGVGDRPVRQRRRRKRSQRCRSRQSSSFRRSSQRSVSCFLGVSPIKWPIAGKTARCLASRTRKYCATQLVRQNVAGYQSQFYQAVNPNVTGKKPQQNASNYQDGGLGSDGSEEASELRNPGRGAVCRFARAAPARLPTAWPRISARSAKTASVAAETAAQMSNCRPISKFSRAWTLGARQEYDACRSPGIARRLESQNSGPSRKHRVRAGGRSTVAGSRAKGLRPPRAAAA